jgi:hypothetical protein
MHKRQSDREAADFPRSESRTFQRDGKWYFSSREGDFGPFASEAEATQDMETYVGMIDLRPEHERPVTPD